MNLVSEGVAHVMVMVESVLEASVITGANGGTAGRMREKELREILDVVR